MATNHTSNYQLHLWEPGDSFLREEFNENSEKVDGALGELRYQKLLDVTTQTSAQQIDLDVSGIDFLQYNKIELCFSSDITNVVLYLRVNNVSDAAYRTQGNSGSNSDYGTWQNHMLYWSCASGAKNSVVLNFNRPMAGGSFGAWLLNMSAHERYSNAVFQFGAPVYITWDQVNTLNFYVESGILPAGTNFTIYGVRK